MKPDLDIGLISLKQYTIKSFLKSDNFMEHKFSQFVRRKIINLKLKQERKSHIIISNDLPRIEMVFLQQVHHLDHNTHSRKDEQGTPQQ